MTKKPANHGKPWTPSDDQSLKKLATQNTPTRVIPLRREIHPDLRCLAAEPQDYTRGGGGGCKLPVNLEELAERELRGNYQESRRRGWLLIA